MGLQQSLLNLPVLPVLGHEKRLFGHGIDSGPVHRRSQRHRSGNESLHLLQIPTLLLEIPEDGLHFFVGRSRKTADKIRNNILFLSSLSRDFLKITHKLIEVLEAWFLHKLKNFVIQVFRGHLEMTAYVMSDEFSQILTPGFFIC